MAAIYFDASALVKLLRDEVDSERAATIWNGCDQALSSRLVHAEVCAAVAAVHRNGALTDAEAELARATWRGHWNKVLAVDLSNEVALVAGEVAASQALGGADAVHLASALALRNPDVVFATWDRRLHAAAGRSGLQVAPATLS